VEAFKVEADVAGGPNAAWRARRFVDTQLTGRIPQDTLADVALLVTELVANGVRHGGVDQDSAMRVLLQGSAPGLHVEVTNQGSADAVRIRNPDLGGGGGLGLHIVARVASRWGVVNGPTTAVWFEVDV
jgi:anti-sigma regulatory factor (Ser/Thr protein kinase)